MEIIVHGTKGGYKILYKTPNAPYSISRDARRFDNNDRSPIGQSAFALALAENGYVFSKYVIVRDTERGSIGNIAFSLYLPGTEKMSGLDIKNLLDELALVYERDYITNGNLRIKQEDWSFVEKITQVYQEKIQSISGANTKELVQGAEDPAFIYYSKEKDLLAYFDNPFQKEYLDHRQVFFVDAELKDQKENPLNALRHKGSADLSGIIDVRATYYRLYGISGPGEDGISIQVWANDVEKKEGDIIQKHDYLRICFSKKFHYSEEVSGSLADGALRRYIRINNKRMSVDKNVFFRPEHKKILFLPQDIHGNAKKNVTFVCVNSNTQEVKNIVDRTAVFSGDEIGENWEITARAGDLKGYNVFIPSQIHSLRLIMRSSGGSRDTLGNPQYNSDEPSTENIRAFLKSNLKLILVILPFIFLINIVTRQILSVPQDPDHNVIPDTKYDTPDTVTDSDASQNTDFTDQRRVINIDNIINYTKGVELNREILNTYINSLCNQDLNTVSQSVVTDDGAPIDEATRTSLCQRLTLALSIRTAIDLGDIKSLKRIPYASDQRRFRDVIRQISNNHSSAITSKMRINPAPDKDLNEIADSIVVWYEMLVPGRSDEPNNQQIEADRNAENNGTSYTNEAEARRSTPNNRNAAYDNTPTNSRATSSQINDRDWSDPQERQFWAMIHSTNLPPQSEFAAWYINSNYMYNNKYKLFYHDYLRVNSKFVRLTLLSVSCRRSATTLETLIALINDPNSCR